MHVHINILADHLYDLPTRQQDFPTAQDRSMYQQKTQAAIFATQMLTMIEKLKAEQIQQGEEMKQPELCQIKISEQERHSPMVDAKVCEILGISIYPLSHFSN